MSILRSKKLLIVLLFAILLGLSLVVGACSTNNQTEEQKPSVAFGEENEKTKALTLENATGKTVAEVSVVSTGQTDTKKLAAQGEQNKWEPGTKAVINLPEMQANTATTGSGNVTLRPSCDITFTCDGGATYTIHGFVINSVDSISDAKLNLNSADNLFYLTYRSNDADVNTLSNEQKVVADAKAAADAAAAQKAAEEAAAKAAADAAAAESSSNSSSSSRSSSDSSSGSSGSSGQSSNGCVEGGVKLR